MDDQIADQETRADLRTNLWLNGAVILGLVLAALNHFVHAWDGGSYLAAALCLLNVACIYLLSGNIAQRWKK